MISAVLEPHFSSRFQSFVFVAAVIFLTACSQVNPDISAVEELPALLIDSGSQKFSSKNLPQLDINITGSVSKFANRLQVSADGGASWQEVTNSLVQGLVLNQSACTDYCPFSFLISDVGSKWPVYAGLAIDGEAKLLVRGIGQFGQTAPGEIVLKRIKGGFISLGSVAGQNGSSISKRVASGKYLVLGGRIASSKTTTLNGIPGVSVQGAQQ